MESGKQMSDLKITRVECPKCGAVWINGQHYWSGTGNKGNELDLAGLVCNNLGDSNCINPSRGLDGGDTWNKRMSDIDEKSKEMNDRLNEDFDV